MKKVLNNNTAFIDGQNFYLGTKEDGFSVDLKKFRIYLKDKYNITEAYYFLGYPKGDDSNPLYVEIQKAGFITIFKKHGELAISLKKGNVDTDIVFEMMKNIIESTDNHKLLLVSGDGDYFKTVDYLVRKNRFLKILFPNKKYASSLYKQLGAEFFDYLKNIRTVIEKK